MSALVWDDVSDDDAAQLRADYLSNFPERLDRFLDSLSDDVRSRADRTLASLDIVWRWWVDTHAPPDAIEDEASFLALDLPLWARAAHGVALKIGADNAQASSDLAAYVAATVLERYPEAVWTTNHEREYIDARRPLLSRIGHGVPFFPDDNVGILCYRALTQPPRGTDDPREASALRRMVELLCGDAGVAARDGAGGSLDDESPPVVVCRPLASMPRRTYLVLLDEDLALANGEILAALRARLESDRIVTNVDDNDDRSLMVTLKRFSSQHDLYAIVSGFVAEH